LPHREDQPLKARNETAIRRAIVEVYDELARRGMNFSSAGNVSVRCGDGMLVTPTGCTEETLKPSHIVATGFDGAHAGKYLPSSEWAMHAEVYRRVPSTGAVIHTHADNCVALAALRKPIPAFHYMIHGFGGDDVPCVGYHAFGTPELARAAAKAMETRTGCLLANHGMLTRGATLRAAFEAAVRLETLARQYRLALSAGEPVVLNPAEMARVAERYVEYGRQPRPVAKLPWRVP
jgi:L-fuculose-phosphate aldolase